MIESTQKQQGMCKNCNKITEHLWECGEWWCRSCGDSNILSRSGRIREEDQVNHPKHYTSHPSGVECIDIVEHMNYNLGNSVKYIWRADLKGKDIQDLEKAEFYIRREIERRKKYGKKN